MHFIYFALSSSTDTSSTLFCSSFSIVKSYQKRKKHSIIRTHIILGENLPFSLYCLLKRLFWYIFIFFKWFSSSSSSLFLSSSSSSDSTPLSRFFFFSSSSYFLFSSFSFLTRSSSSSFFSFNHHISRN